MRHAIRPTFLALATMLLFALAALPARSDVAVERVYRGPLPGLVGATELNEKVFYKGLGRRAEPSTEVRTSKMLLWGSAKKAEIVRVDRELVWNVHVAKKAYTEEPLARPQSPGGPPGAEPRAAKEDTPTERIVKSELKVEQTGEKKDLNGFPTERYRLTWLIETENIESKQRSTTLYTADFWNTAENHPKLVALYREAGAFDDAYARKLGLTESPQYSAQYGLDMLAGMFGETDAAAQAEMRKLRNELGKIKGHPIVVEVKIGTPIADAGKEEPSAERDRSLTGQAVGGLMKFIGEKKEQPKADERGMVVIFESYHEIRGVETSPLGADLFEPPPGFKKVKEL